MAINWTKIVSTYARKIYIPRSYAGLIVMWRKLMKRIQRLRIQQHTQSCVRSLPYLASRFIYSCPLNPKEFSKPICLFKTWSFPSLPDNPATYTRCVFLAMKNSGKGIKGALVYKGESGRAVLSLHSHSFPRFTVARSRA